MYNLTPRQKDLLRCFVQQVNQGYLSEEFIICWTFEGSSIPDYSGEEPLLEEINKGAIQALTEEGLLRSQYIGKSQLRCTLTGKAYEAVDTNFNAPDTSLG